MTKRLILTLLSLLAATQAAAQPLTIVCSDPYDGRIVVALTDLPNGDKALHVTNEASVLIVEGKHRQKVELVGTGSCSTHPQENDLQHCYFVADPATNRLQITLTDYDGTEAATSAMMLEFEISRVVSANAHDYSFRTAVFAGNRFLSETSTFNVDTCVSR